MKCPGCEIELKKLEAFGWQSYYGEKLKINHVYICKKCDFEARVSDKDVITEFYNGDEWDDGGEEKVNNPNIIIIVPSKEFKRRY